MPDSNRGEQSKAIGNAFAILASIALVAVIVGVLAYSQGREVENRYQTAAAHADASKQTAERTCVGSDPAAVFECVHEEVKSSQQQAQAEQDLDAQQGMKFWAAVMAVLSGVTAVITGIGVWFVKKTLETNESFVQESKDATAAMVGANLIALQAQRPWFAINTSLVRIQHPNHNSIRFGFNVSFKNIGSMTAESFYTRVRLTYFEPDAFIDGMGKVFDEFVDDVVVRDSVVVPNDTNNYAGDAGAAIQYLPWAKDEAGNPTHCVAIILAMARYKIPGEPGWRYAMKGFSVGSDIDHIFNRHLYIESVRKMTFDNTIVQPMGISRAT